MLLFHFLGDNQSWHTGYRNSSPRRYTRTINIKVTEPAIAPAIAQIIARFGSFRLIKITGTNTKAPATAPATSDRTIRTGKRAVLNHLVWAAARINRGVMIKAGRYVSHSGTVMSPKKAMPTTVKAIRSGLIDSPSREGLRHTIVEQATSGATVNMQIMQIVVRFIRIAPQKHTMD
jgi:hypothetical protein